MKYHVYDRAVKAITRITDDADVELVPAYTNIRHLCDDRVLWLENFFGAVLASHLPCICKGASHGLHRFML